LNVFDTDGQGAHARPLWSAPSAEERTVQGHDDTERKAEGSRSD
jgi:hypothetical protein